MADKRRPTHTKIKKASNHISSKEMASLSSFKSSEEYNDEKKITQLSIDRYNEYSIYELDPFFKTFTPPSNHMVVRMFMENEINFADESNILDRKIQTSIRQVDIRKNNTEKPNFVNTPFPYIEQGLIVSISPDVTYKYIKMREEIAKHDKELAEKVHIPKVGDIVHIKANESHFYKTYRFYPDKQKKCLDFIFSQDDMKLLMFKAYHYFLIEDFYVEGFITDHSNKDKYWWEGEKPKLKFDRAYPNATIPEVTTFFEQLPKQEREKQLKIREDFIKSQEHSSNDKNEKKKSGKDDSGKDKLEYNL
jgi:hypothetical protein